MTKYIYKVTLYAGDKDVTLNKLSTGIFGTTEAVNNIISLMFRPESNVTKIAIEMVEKSNEW